MTIEFNQVGVTLIGSPSAPSLTFNEVRSDVLGSGGMAQRRFNQEFVNALGVLPAPTRKVNQVFVNVLATRTPLYGFTSVICSDVFPCDISYNSVGSVRFATDVIVVDSGDDQRVGRWDQPLMEYDIAYGVRTMEQLLALISFFRAMRGRLNAFNYQDNVDFTSSIPVAYESRKAPPPAPGDQLIAIGNGNDFSFQLTKTYATATQSLVRPITRPELHTIVMALNGVQVFNWTSDLTTGIVTFSPPLGRTFSHSLTKTTAGVGGGCTITGAAGDFTDFVPYIGSPVIMSGWTQALNNVPLNTTTTPTTFGAPAPAPTPANPVLINAVATDGSTMTLTTSCKYGMPADSATNVTICVHPAPLVGVQITAGYQFYVPCRFDTDVLPVTLEDYGVGSSNSIKLIEVRPSAF